MKDDVFERLLAEVRQGKKRLKSSRGDRTPGSSCTAVPMTLAQIKRLELVLEDLIKKENKEESR